jgi:drug/metabolite transporter (DMT)-like permease
MRATVNRAPDAFEEHYARAYLFMLSSSLAFAVMGALSHVAGGRCEWQVVAAARTSVAFVLSATLAVLTGVRLVWFRPLTLWMRSGAGSVGLLCSFYALTHLPVSTALTLSNTVPVWVTLLAWPALGQRPSRGVWAAVAAGLAGIVLIQRPETAADRWASLAALGSALCTAVAMIGLNRLGGVDARAVVTHFSGVSTAVTLAVLLLSGGAAAAGGAFAEPTTPLLLAGVGLAGTLGQLTMTRAFALGTPARVSVVGLTQIVFAIAFDALLWRRRFDALTILGILLVAAPSAWLMLHHPLRKSTPIHTTT